MEIWGTILFQFTVVSPVYGCRNNNKALQWFLRLWPGETPSLYVYGYSPVHSRRNHCIVLSVIYGKCLRLYIEVLANNIFRLRTDFTACQLGRQHRHYRHPWTPLLYKRTLFLSLDNLSYYLCLHFLLSCASTKCACQCHIFLFYKLNELTKNRHGIYLKVWRTIIMEHAGSINSQRTKQEN